MEGAARSPILSHKKFRGNTHPMEKFDYVFLFYYYYLLILFILLSFFIIILIILITFDYVFSFDYYFLCRTVQRVLAFQENLRPPVFALLLRLRVHSQDRNARPGLGIFVQQIWLPFRSTSGSKSQRRY